jgi:hypothetical protein
MRDLHLSEADMAIAAHALSVELHVELTASALSDPGTVDDLVDRVVVLTGDGREGPEARGMRPCGANRGAQPRGLADDRR